VNKISAVIETGLETGDVVVTDGQYRIETGSTVEVLTKAAGPSG
jgi:multidrug efflux system membrane fusion protein